MKMKTKSLIAALLLAASSAFAQVPSYVPTNGLVGWWPFNGNANDASGNGNNGTVNGATLTTDRFGITANCYSYDGNADYISVPNSNSLNPSQISISVWVHANKDNGGIVEKSNPTNAMEFGYSIGHQDIWCLPRGLKTSIGNGICNSTSYSPPNPCSNPLPTSNGIWGPLNAVANNQWQFITMTIDTTKTIKQYINGVLNFSGIVSTNLISCNTSTSTLRFGMHWNNDPEWFDGKIDDIGIWNRALTQQEITALYNAQLCNSSSNTIIADGPTTFCAGNYVNLTSDVVGGTYQWRRNGINITTNATSRTFKASTTGSYTCVATCNGTALTSNAIAVNSKTNASATVTASGATSFCLGDSLTLNCTNLGSNYSVQWYRTNVSMENATNYSLVVKQPGTYKVVTRNLTNGCSRISGSAITTSVNCRIANPDVVSAELVSTDLDAKVAGEDPKGKIYIYPNPTSDNKFTVELMGLELNGDATLEVYNAMGQILSSEKVNITNSTLNRTIQIDEQSKGQLCLVRLIAGNEVYDSKVILK
jgi:hypothetical protein